MAIQPTSANASTTSLTQKLRDLGRLRNKSDERLEKGFEIVHTPDRPTRLVTLVEAPTEDECGDEIARWQRASVKQRINVFRERPEVEREAPAWYNVDDAALTSLNPQDDAAVTAESDEDTAGHDQQYATRVVYGKEVGRGGHVQQTGLQHTQSLKPMPQRQVGPSQTEVGRQQPYTPAPVFPHGMVKMNHAAAMIASTQAPLFSGTARSLPTSHPRSVSPALATVAGDNTITRPRYTRVRMEIYPRGFCPYCRKFFGKDPLPLNCPYLDCRRDLRVCQQYPNRREAEKAPPRLAQRAFLDISTRPGGNARGLTRRPSIPNLRVEVPTPTDEKQPPARHGAPSPPPPSSSQQRHNSPSLSNTIRTIWPSPLGIYDPSHLEPTQPLTPSARPCYLEEKPLPPPPLPPIRSDRRRPPPPPPPFSPPFSPSSSTISERHQQLYTPISNKHITSQLRTPPPSLSSTPPVTSTPSPLSSNASISTSSSSTRNPRTANSPASSPPPSHTITTQGPGVPPSRFAVQQHFPPPPSSFPGEGRGGDRGGDMVKERGGERERETGRGRRRRPSSSHKVDDADFLAWKTPAERKRFETEVRERGDDADLFMDIIGQYDDGEGSSCGDGPDGDGDRGKRGVEGDASGGRKGSREGDWY
ncbi:hypothetical protein C8A01DRAFT_30948 [Parachaetomium inaequale]|uniref:Uncharacterized protein n=1 Tax=Parachaetomium inaequale TaxID=2588326 RepID=A0AAN6SWL2_9PEZI|nr:hypothetical protein C8A01DRAFT_30948 [Parachaetomium inaequale]